MRVLDEVADAIQIARNRLPQLVLSSFKLEDQFGGPVMGAHWTRMERHLACSLPPLDFDQGHWWLPDELSTIWDLCDHVARQHPNWKLPEEKTPAAWRNAQVFAVVRRVLVDASNLNPREVIRNARLQRDLGLL